MLPASGFTSPTTVFNVVCGFVRPERGTIVVFEGDRFKVQLGWVDLTLQHRLGPPR